MPYTARARSSRLSLPACQFAHVVAEASTLRGSRDSRRWSLKRFSLRTDKRAEAEFLAAPFIRDHRLFLVSMKDVSISRARLMNIPHHGGPLPPTLPKLYTLEEARLEMERTHGFTDAAFGPSKLVPLMAEVKPVSGGADNESLIAAWKRKKVATSHVENDARRTLTFYRKHVSKKPLTDCTREDGEKLVDLLFKNPKAIATLPLTGVSIFPMPRRPQRSQPPACPPLPPSLGDRLREAERRCRAAASTNGSRNGRRS